MVVARQTFSKNLPNNNSETSAANRSANIRHLWKWILFIWISDDHIGWFTTLYILGNLQIHQKGRLLFHIRLDKIVRDKHSSSLDSFVRNEEIEVL